MKITIREYRSDDHEILADIFTAGIHKAGPEYYTPDQLNAWAPKPVDYEMWRDRFNERPPFVAESEGEIVGFMTLAKDGYIDWTYVHPDHHRNGIAGILYQHLETKARSRGHSKLYVDASHMAKSFFERKNFRSIFMNSTCKGVVILHNWRMEKTLSRKN